VVVLAMVFGKTILLLVFPSDYAQIATTFGLLCAYVAVVIQTTPLAQVFYGIGLPEKQRMFVIFRVVLIVLLIYPAIKQFGTIGAALTLLGVNIAALLFQVHLLGRNTGLRISQYMTSWLPGFVSAGILLFILLLANSVWPEREHVRFGIGIVCCAMLMTIFMFYQKLKKRFGRTLNNKDSFQ